MEAQALAAELRRVFAAREPPPAEQMVWPATWESDDLIAAFGRVDPLNLRGEFIDDFSDSLPALTARGIETVLGQYLAHAVEHPDHGVTHFALSGLGGFIKPGADWCGASFAFTPAQINAVLSFLDFMKPLDPHSDFLIEEARRAWTT